MSYTRLTAHEREEIALGFAAERTYEAIAADLGRSKSTIWREARRGGGAGSSIGRIRARPPPNTRPAPPIAVPSCCPPSPRC